MIAAVTACTGTQGCRARAVAAQAALDIDHVPSSHLVYVGTGRAGKLTIAWVDAKGTLTPIAIVLTKQGARNPAAASDGSVYLQTPRPASSSSPPPRAEQPRRHGESVDGKLTP